MLSSFYLASSYSTRKPLTPTWPTTNTRCHSSFNPSSHRIPCNPRPTPWNPFTIDTSFTNQFQELQERTKIPQIHELFTPGSSTSSTNTLKPPKLNLPPFDGSNPLDWIFQADQFFTHYSINPNLRLSYIASYMTGDALAWFQWLHNSHLLSTWERFTWDLELRFGPSTFENHQQALFKLKQTSSVHDYHKEFERLCNRVTALPHTDVLDCFISGLKSEIQHEMSIIWPTSISQAIGLAKLINPKIKHPNLINPSTETTTNQLQHPLKPSHSRYFPILLLVWPYHNHHSPNHPSTSVVSLQRNYKIGELKASVLTAMNGSYRVIVVNRRNFSCYSRRKVTSVHRTTITTLMNLWFLTHLTQFQKLTVPTQAHQPASNHPHLHQKTFTYRSTPSPDNHLQELYVFTLQLRVTPFRF